MSAYQALEQYFFRIAQLEHMLAISSWDEAVMMPSGSAKARARAIASTKAMVHELLQDKKCGELLGMAEQEDLLPMQQANLYWMKREHIKSKGLSQRFIEQESLASINCEQVWRHCKANNNWQDFAPHLEEVIRLMRIKADSLSNVLQMEPYDVLLDAHSPALNQRDLDEIFTQLEAFLPSFLLKVIKHQKSYHLSDLGGNYDIDKQKKLGVKVMQALGFDFNRGRLDVSHHPFCGGVSQDVRITTRYDKQFFLSSLLAICHETGHALYEMGLPQEPIGQPVTKALGMAIHESQSLLIEMQVCRSYEFMHWLTPQLKSTFGEREGFEAENLYRNAIGVEPGLIRVDADEVTYPLHVMMRYQLEKKLLQQDLEVTDLPHAWDHYMQSYFSISTGDNYAQGVMQDVHWAAGAFGYFPAYTIGAIIAAQLFDSARRSIPNLQENMHSGQFHNLVQWLYNNVHQKGASKHYQDLLLEATNSKLSIQPFVHHLQKRYLEEENI